MREPAERSFCFPREAALRTIEFALAEDIHTGDLTSEATVPATATASAELVAKEAGIAAGLPVVAEVFARVDQRARIRFAIREGQRFEVGSSLAVIEGPTRAILAAERVALNFLQHLSGIATATARAVELVAGTKATILDTRKTTPGLRALEKYAVRVGGGANHRMGLYDLVMIKDNHITAAGSISQAVAAARAAVSPLLKVEVECSNLTEVHEALACHADIIMLDNMSVVLMCQAVALIGGTAITEASGNMTDDKLRAVAASGVDYISMGTLTHSVKAIDVSLKVRS